jgi:hypothetical protein
MMRQPCTGNIANGVKKSSLSSAPREQPRSGNGDRPHWHGLSQETIAWLLKGDVSIQFQVRRDLLGEDPVSLEALQRRIAAEGWGARFLSLQRPDGHWGRGYYQPKWISTHYTLFDIRNLEPVRDLPTVRAIIEKTLTEMTGPDGGIYFSPSFFLENRSSDVCINGMFLNLASYFRVTGKRPRELADLLIACRMGDFGWNCEQWKGATHSSTHTTISVLEGLSEFALADPRYRVKELAEAIDAGARFLLEHELFKSHRTGEMMDDRFLMLSYPSRWKYDILRALEWFARAGRPWDSRLDPALDILARKRRADGTWPLQHKHPGAVHFDMEATGRPSRWNTLRAARVMAAYGENPANGRGSQ